MKYSKYTPKAVREQLEDRDGDAPLCILCLAGVPAHGPCGVATCYHHMRKPRSLPANNKAHLLAPVGQYHHEAFDEAEIYARALIKLGRQSPEDYPDLDNAIYPPFGECVGNFGYGTKYFGGQIPKTLIAVYGRTNDHIENFCVFLCPQATQCLMETRKLRRHAATKGGEI